MAAPPPQPHETALVTFVLHDLHGIGTVDIYGSWDNFRVPYPMTKDTQKGHGTWYGCPEFDGIICDGNPSLCTAPRKGALKMGGTYWYYYVLNGKDEFYDKTTSSTTDCPLRPGQDVNVITIPLEPTDSGQFSAANVLLNPLARTVATNLPQTPADHPYRKAKRAVLPLPEIVPLKWNQFNDTLARLQTAVADAVIANYVFPHADTAEAYFNRDILVGRICRHAASRSDATVVQKGSAAAHGKAHHVRQRMGSRNTEQQWSRSRVLPQGLLVKEFSNPFMDIHKFPHASTTAGDIHGQARPVGPLEASRLHRPHSCADAFYGTGAFERDLERSLLRSRCERRTKTAMGTIVSAPHLLRKGTMSKRISLTKSLSIRNRTKSSRTTPTAPLQLDTEIASNKTSSLASHRTIGSTPSETPRLGSQGHSASISRATSQRVTRMASIKERLLKPGKRSPSDAVSRPQSNGGPQREKSAPHQQPAVTMADVHESSMEERTSLATTVGEDPAPLAVVPGVEQRRQSDTTDDRKGRTLRHRVSQRFIRSSRERSKSASRQTAPSAKGHAESHCVEPNPTGSDSTGKNPPEGGLRRKLSQRFARKDTVETDRPIDRNNHSVNGEAALTIAPSDQPLEKTSLRRKLSKIFGFKSDNSRSTPISPTSPDDSSMVRGGYGGSRSDDPSASQETIRPVAALDGAPEVPQIPEKFRKTAEKSSLPQAIPQAPNKPFAKDIQWRVSADHNPFQHPDDARARAIRSRYQSGLSDDSTEGVTPPLVLSSEFSTPSTFTLASSMRDVDFEEEPRESFSEEKHRHMIRSALKGTPVDQGPRSSFDLESDSIGDFDYLSSHIG